MTKYTLDGDTAFYWHNVKSPGAHTFMKPLLGAKYTQAQAAKLLKWRLADIYASRTKLTSVDSLDVALLTAMMRQEIEVVVRRYGGDGFKAKETKPKPACDITDAVAVYEMAADGTQVTFREFVRYWEPTNSDRIADSIASYDDLCSASTRGVSPDVLRQTLAYENTLPPKARQAAGRKVLVAAQQMYKS